MHDICLILRSAQQPKQRLNKITKINTEAAHWSELIDLSQRGICEPSLTDEFTKQVLQDALLYRNKLDLPDLPSHSQSVERAVKLTSEASHMVYGLESRHKHILARQMSRSLRPSFASKGSYNANFDEMDF